ncbi:MAG TPA: hypothetical protein VFO25_08275 [Candidatus Eremiobacteraceae bacterium]|nr:hypothetical protein [Candidatus Eremiobacteraceae bacterium]
MSGRTMLLLAILLGGCTSEQAQQQLGAANPVQPWVLQNGQQPTQWVVFPTIFQPAGIAVGPDKQIWVTAQDTEAVYRVTVKTGRISAPAAVGFQPGPIVAGSDGNMWTCGSAGQTGGLARITPTLQATTYAAPGLCGGITVGPDGAIWFTSIADCALERATTDGVITETVSPFCPSNPHEIITGSDGNLWFTERGAGGVPVGVVRYDLGSGFTEFQTSKEVVGLALGYDGNLYGCWNPEKNAGGQLAQISIAGSVATFSLETKCRGSTQPTSGLRDIYYTTTSGNGARWNVHGHGDFAYGQSPSKNVSIAMAVGEDDNVWNADVFKSVEVFVNRILTVEPSAATIQVGGSQNFSVSETGCKCNWTARSSDPAVASASAVSGGVFTVTALAQGSAIITVADSKMNTFRVSITVQ